MKRWGDLQDERLGAYGEAAGLISSGNFGRDRGTQAFSLVIHDPEASRDTAALSLCGLHGEREFLNQPLASIGISDLLSNVTHWSEAWKQARPVRFVDPRVAYGTISLSLSVRWGSLRHPNLRLSSSPGLLARLPLSVREPQTSISSTKTTTGESAKNIGMRATYEPTTKN